MPHPPRVFILCRFPVCWGTPGLRIGARASQSHVLSPLPGKSEGVFPESLRGSKVSKLPHRRRKIRARHWKSGWTSTLVGGERISRKSQKDGKSCCTFSPKEAGFSGFLSLSFTFFLLLSEPFPHAGVGLEVLEGVVVKNPQFPLPQGVG